MSSNVIHVNFVTKSKVVPAMVNEVASPTLVSKPNNIVGDKYETTKSLDVAEIAKLVRKDIKSCKKIGVIPKGAKVSVRISRFSGGTSIDMTIREVPGMQVHNPAWLDWGINPETKHKAYPTLVELPRYTPEAKDLKETLTSIVNRYNYDKSDSMTDYYNVRFYEHITFGGTIFTDELHKRQTGLVAVTS